jgi:SAM-dependent methyltransferase
VASARAVYDAGAARYVEFVGTEIGPATEGPVDRSLLQAFVELVEAGPGTRVADVGCGPGRAAAFLAGRGLDAVGFDVSPAMVAAARRAHPQIPFVEARFDDLPVETGSLAGVVCWYSIIYTPPERVHDVLVELRRVIVAGGHVLLAFQSGGGEEVHRPDAHGTGLPLSSHRHRIGELTYRLEAAGFAVHATAERAADLAHETGSQAFVIARRRAGVTDR